MEITIRVGRNMDVKLKVKVSIDGDKWSVLYGDNLQEGICGFGESPAEATEAFYAAFYNDLPKQKSPENMQIKA